MSRPWPPTATYSGNDYVQRLKDTVRESAVVDVDAGKDPNEVVRAMVVTDVPAAVEQTENADYTAAVQSSESRTLRSQESIVRQARRITGRSVINQSGYLVSAFSMDMTRAQMKQVAALDGVVSVSEVTSYQARMTTAKDMTSDMELWKAENGGNTGEGIVVAVIDSGVNYSHPDMQIPIRHFIFMKRNRVFCKFPCVIKITCLCFYKNVRNSSKKQHDYLDKPIFILIFASNFS